VKEKKSFFDRFKTKARIKPEKKPKKKKAAEDGKDEDSGGGAASRIGRARIAPE
jgi:hypothetical protein